MKMKRRHTGKSQSFISLTGKWEKFTFTLKEYTLQIIKQTYPINNQ